MDEQIEYQPPPQQQYMPHQHAAMDPGLAQWILHLYDVLEDLVHTLKAEVPKVTYDKNTGAELKTWIRVGALKPKLNAQGVSFVRWNLYAFVNRNATMSDIDDVEIEKIGTPTCQAIALELGFDRKKYGLEISSYDTVCQMISNFCFFTLKRAWHGGERSFIKDTTQRVEMFRPQQEQGGGLFGIFRGGGR